MRSPQICLLLIAGLISGLSIPPAVARDLRPGIFGKDDRRAIDQGTDPWPAIGQVNVAGYRQVKKCTGTLVATNLVLTAAHCVMDPWRRKPFPLHQIHFLAGVRGSEWVAHSKAKCLHFPPGYEYLGPRKNLPSRPFQEVPQRALSKDLALIVLADELKDIAPLKIESVPVAGADVPLVHASFAADRRNLLTGHFGCRLLAQREGLWFTDCDTHAASSGGPVFVRQDGNLRLAAVMVGIARESASIAVPTSTWAGIGAKRTCP